MQALLAKRNRYGGLLIALVGIGAILQARQYTIGTLLDMGSGFFPLVLGVILVGCGITIALGSSVHEEEPGSTPIDRADWRGWLCILGGLLCFLFIGGRFGMFPGTATCVFVAAMGDRTTTWRGALILALAVSTVGTLLFFYGLRVQLPAFTW